MTSTSQRARLTTAQAELLRGRNWGIVTTLREDGSPHATPVWVDTDGESILFNTAVGRAKERHLRHDPRVAITVLPADDQQAGYVSVSGTAELSEDGAVEHIHELSHKYLGTDYPWLQPDEERVIVAIRPERIDAQGIG
jgi:PPOX class probable F420-dependent enzyme